MTLFKSRPAASLAATASFFAVALRASASEPIPVEVTLTAAARPVRVMVREGVTTPCDAGDNRALFDGWMEPGQSFKTTIASECVCVQHTRDRFPRTDWSRSTLVCRPRVCRGRICRPAPDPTIRVRIDGRSR